MIKRQLVKTRCNGNNLKTSQQPVLRRIPQIPTTRNYLTREIEDGNGSTFDREEAVDLQKGHRLGWKTAVASLLGFSTVSYDVFGARSLHLLQPVDDWGHAVAQSIDPTTGEWLWRTLISNTSIAAGNSVRRIIIVYVVYYWILCVF
jgi:hypothetical protein